MKASLVECRYFITLAVLFIFVPGCGGGTVGSSGTGNTGGGSKSGHVISGRLTTPIGDPIAGAAISIEGASAESRTSRSGNFSLFAPFADVAELVISGDMGTRHLELAPFAGETSALRLDITFSAERAELHDLELTVRSVGGRGCEGAFSPIQVFSLASADAPLLIVEQQAVVHPGTKCEAEVSTRSGGKPLEGVGVRLYFFPFAPFDSGDSATSQVLSEQLVTEADTGPGGTLTLQFAPNLPSRGAGYFVVEAPSSRPASERLAVVINTLISE